MENKNILLDKVNAMNSCDPMVQEVLKAIGISLDNTAEDITSVFSNLFFATCSEEMLSFYESEAGISPQPGQSLNDRRSALEAKWKSSGKVDLKLIQSVANAWRKDAVADYKEGIIQITFTTSWGEPDELPAIEKALDEVKPAHLPVKFMTRYLSVSNVNSITIAELEKQKIAFFSFD